MPATRPFWSYACDTQPVKAPVALFLAAAAVLTAAGCSHPATSSSPTVATSASSAPTPTPTPTPSPTPTLPTMEQARDTYLRLVVPSDKAGDAYNKAIDQHKPWRTLRSRLAADCRGSTA